MTVPAPSTFSPLDAAETYKHSLRRFLLRRFLRTRTRRRPFLAEVRHGLIGKPAKSFRMSLGSRKVCPLGPAARETS
jgi:hypothetical protein